jgi:tripartite-type tricarboxylate transporter receptor subunit TctC
MLVLGAARCTGFRALMALFGRDKVVSWRAQRRAHAMRFPPFADRCLINIAVAALLLHETVVCAADATAAWPTRPVHIVVGYPAGTSPDTLARLLADPLAKSLGQAIVVDNKPGASGNIGVELVVHGSDGYTFGITTNGPLTTAKQLVDNLPYDATKDIKPLSLAATSPLVLVCDPAVPATTLKEFIAWAKTQNVGVTYGSIGQGSGSHLTMALFASKAEIRMEHVPYQGFPQVMNAILGHQVQCGFMAPSGALAQAKAGKVRMFAVSSPERSPLLPDVPTVAEAGGIGDFRADLWIAAFGPANMPAAVASKLAGDINAALNQPDVREKLLQQGWQVLGADPQALAKRITEDTTVWGAVIRQANIHAQ